MLDRFKTAGVASALARFKLAEGMTVPIKPFHQDLLFAHHGDLGRAPAAPARPSVSWDEFRQGAADHVRQGLTAGVRIPTPPAAVASPVAAAARIAAPAAAGAAPGFLSRFKMPSVGLGGALGLGALGALGAAAWGMHRQNQQDRNADRLTYTPTQGGFY